MTLLSALTALLSLVLAAQGVASGNWTGSSCLTLGGDIEIATQAGQQEKVPDNATVLGYCDETASHPMTFTWEQEKELIFFVKTEDLFKTFQLEMIQYKEGNTTWFTTPRGIKGNIGGGVKCRSPIDFNLRPKDASNDAPKHITLWNFSLKYTNGKINATESESVCRTEADLTVVLGVSGGITAFALLAAAAVAAPRLLC